MSLYLDNFRFFLYYVILNFFIAIVSLYLDNFRVFYITQFWIFLLQLWVYILTILGFLYFTILNFFLGLYITFLFMPRNSDIFSPNHKFISHYSDFCLSIVSLYLLHLFHYHKIVSFNSIFLSLQRRLSRNSSFLHLKILKLFSHNRKFISENFSFFIFLISCDSFLCLAIQTFSLKFSFFFQFWPFSQDSDINSQFWVTKFELPYYPAIKNK